MISGFSRKDQATHVPTEAKNRHRHGPFLLATATSFDHELGANLLSKGFTLSQFINSLGLVAAHMTKSGVLERPNNRKEIHAMQKQTAYGFADATALIDEQVLTNTPLQTGVATSEWIHADWVRCLNPREKIHAPSEHIPFNPVPVDFVIEEPMQIINNRL